MKQFKWKNLLCLLLAAALLFGLIGCSDDADTEGPDITQPIAPETPQPEPQPVEADETGFISNDGFVTEFHAIQVMARGLNTDTGELFDMTQFVAGKDTVLRASFVQPVYVEQDGSMYVSIIKNGEEIAQLLPVNSGETNVAFFIPRNLGDVGNWAAGDYELIFVYGESAASRTLTFREAKRIKVLAVPVLANYAGRVVACEGEWQTAIQFTRDTYPLANDGIEYVLGAELDLSDDMYDLTTDEGQYYVWEALTNLQTPNNDYELILGFVRERQGEGYTQGYTYGKPANIITESDGDMQPTVAHEIAHCYFVGDEYPGGTMNTAINPPPYGMEGSDWNDRDASSVGMKQSVVSANEFGNENTGSILFPDQVPMNSTQQLILGNVGSFMGSGSDDMMDYWITSDIWSQLYKAYVFDHASTGGGEPSASQEGGASENPFCPSCYTELASPDECEFYGYCDYCGGYTPLDLNEVGDTFECENCWSDVPVNNNSVIVLCLHCYDEYPLSQLFGGATAKQAMSAKMDDIAQAEPVEMRVIDITGTVYKSGEFRANPWYSYTGYSTDIGTKRTGGYAIVMEDAAGSVISTQHFSVSFHAQTNPPRALDYAAVNVTARYPENAAVIRLFEGEKELYSVAVSQNAPEIAFTGISENQLFAGKETIQWEGADADGDEVYYELWYCPSEEEFYNIASNITQTSYTVDFSTLPGTEAGYFYLYATDGANTAEADSEWIQAEYKAPDIISAQKETPEYKITDEILLDADIYDMQDGWLFDYDSVRWMYKGHEFMTGSCLWVFPYELTPGEHTFTLTATNSQGKEAAKDFTFRILDDESALPDDWSREDIKEALANGFVAPLQNVNSAITRGQYAKLMAHLYWNLWEEGAPDPDYEEGVVTDCGQDDYDQFLMVHLGVMDAPGGKFSPNGNLTEHEAAVILYRIIALSMPEGEDPDETEDMMIAACIEAGVMEESGDNAFTAENKITGRLALVRCNRLFQFMFGE